MDKSTVVTLVSTAYETDEFGQKTPVETLFDVFCELQSVSMSEWFEAGRNGIKPEYRLTMSQFDYDGQTEVIIFGKRYGIYRTYIYKNDNIELYVEQKAGVQNG